MNTSSSPTGAAELGARIHFLVLCAADEAPAQRLKFEQYYERFRRAGFEVVHGAFYTSALYRTVVARYSVEVNWPLYGRAVQDALGAG